MKDRIDEFNQNGKDFFDTKWGEIIKSKIKEEVQIGINLLENTKRELLKYPELQKFCDTICFDIQKLEEIGRALVSWDKTYNVLNGINFDRWPIDKKVSLQQKDDAKEIRDKIKKEIRENIIKLVPCTSEEVFTDLNVIHGNLERLKDLVIEFENKFSKKKREKNIIDFNDIEHMALKILVKQDEDGNIIQTDVAKKYQEKFKEIAIDEYQDSNEVQEYILSSISNGKNIFMVGDVKQSIYKFRQAKPELFLTKYKEYKTKDEQIEGENLKIKLFKNFRSRKNILDITNLIFQNIMSEKLGSIEYNEGEYLNLGADYKVPDDELNYAGKTQIYIIDKLDNNNESIQAFKEDDGEVHDNEDDFEYIEDATLEAKFVAKKIDELLKSDYKVYDRKTENYRKIEFRDIVVLLRSTKVKAPIFEKEIEQLNLPVFSDISSEYLGTIEIQIIMSILKIIDNPLQDIPLVTALRSSIWGFTDNELIQIRLQKTNVKFYESLKESMDSKELSDKLREKIKMFLNQIEGWRKKEKYLGLDELIWQIYMETGFYNYVSLMKNGELRQANLKLLFEKASQYEKVSYKGLFNFINFINKLQEEKRSNDMSSAKVIGENDNVIRIMSIHKSKGLEFPVVFLSDMGKQFNIMDMNENILLHQDIGIGTKYNDNVRGIEYTTMTREAIKIKTREELLSEEMRVLYVALTRAKEKLIITGISKDVVKELEQKDNFIKSYKNVSSNNKINKAVVSKAKSYLDWIEYVYKNNEENIEDLVELKILTKQEVLKMVSMEQEDKKDIVELIEEQDIEDHFEVHKILNWKYRYENATSIPNKTSVSKVKQMKIENIQGQMIKEKKNSKEKQSNYTEEMTVPKFLSKNIDSISNASKGTLMHLIIQKLDEKEEYSTQKIKNIIDSLIQREIIFENEGRAIDINRIYEFTKTDFFKNLKKARLLRKEEPFYINIPANEVLKGNERENILVQGIIDLYYIDENGKLILVDYKTDYYNESQEIVNKYTVQLELYKRALEKSLNRRVDKTIIYSLYKMKEIEVL